MEISLSLKIVTSFIACKFACGADKMGTTEDVELKNYFLYMTMKYPVKTAEKYVILYYAIYYMQQESLNKSIVLPQKPLTIYRCDVNVFLKSLIMCLHGGWTWT